MGWASIECGSPRPYSSALSGPGVSQSRCVPVPPSSALISAPMRYAPRRPRTPSITTPTSPRSRSGSGMRIFRRRGCMIAGNRSPKAVRLLRFVIKQRENLPYYQGDIRELRTTDECHDIVWQPCYHGSVNRRERQCKTPKPETRSWIFG